MTRPCLKKDCWCKDVTLPKVGSLWRENESTMDNIFGPKTFRIEISDRHDHMYAEEVDAYEDIFLPKDICFIVNNAINMNYITCLNSFLNDHTPMVKDEV